MCQSFRLSYLSVPNYVIALALQGFHLYAWNLVEWCTVPWSGQFLGVPRNFWNFPWLVWTRFKVRWLILGNVRKSHSLKRKCHHFDESFITGCTESCHFDNFRCSQWWRFHQNEDIFVSVLQTESLWHDAIYHVADHFFFWSSKVEGAVILWASCLHSIFVSCINCPVHHHVSVCWTPVAPISSTLVSDSHLSPPGALQSRRASLQRT